MVVRVGGTSSASGHVKVSARPSDLPRFPGICRSPVPPLEELEDRTRGKKVRMLGMIHSFTVGFEGQRELRKEPSQSQHGPSTFWWTVPADIDTKELPGWCGEG